MNPNPQRDRLNPPPDTLESNDFNVAIAMNPESDLPVLEKVIPALQALKPYLYEQWGVTELAIFGSVARGESQLGSDIDILFDYDRPLGLELVSLADFLEEKLQFKVDLLSKRSIRSRVWDFIGDEIHYV
jgi:uncharacterized protein